MIEWSIECFRDICDVPARMHTRMHTGGRSFPHYAMVPFVVPISFFRISFFEGVIPDELVEALRDSVLALNRTGLVRSDGKIQRVRMVLHVC